MKVSILMPTLNRRAYLAESLGSARAQTYRDIEILVSDDGSTDGSAEYVREVEREDPRVRLLPRNPQPGLFTNINYLVAHAGADAFCILGDDDLLDDRFVEELLAPLEADPAVVATFSDHWVIAPDGRRRQEATDWNSVAYGRAELAGGKVADAVAVAMRGSMCMGFSLYRSDVFKQEPFDLTCGGAADFDYAIRAAQLGDLVYVPERLGSYRSHPGTATGTRPRYMIEGAIRVFRKHHFTDARHERLRKAMLTERLRAMVGYACTEDRGEWLASISDYVRSGGSAWHPKFLMSFGLAAVPHRLGRSIKTQLRSLRQDGAQSA